MWREPNPWRALTSRGEDASPGTPFGRPVGGRSERVGVGGDRRRAGTVEGVDDVDALSRAREEDGRHGGQYSRNGSAASAEAARTTAATNRARCGRRSRA